MRRTICKGDYILITDEYENFYLKIGEVMNIEVDYDGVPTEYKVRFAYDFETSRETLDFYGYDLPEKCKVLLFESR